MPSRAAGVAVRITADGFRISRPLSSKSPGPFREVFTIRARGELPSAFGAIREGLSWVFKNS